MGTLAHVEYFSRGSAQTVAQLEKDGTRMELLGLGEEAFFVAPRGLEVSVGDTVILPALTPSLIGRVQAIENIRTDSFKNVYVSYPFNIFSYVCQDQSLTLVSCESFLISVPAFQCCFSRGG